MQDVFLLLFWLTWFIAVGCSQWVGVGSFQGAAGSAATGFTGSGIARRLSSLRIRETGWTRTPGWLGGCSVGIHSCSTAVVRKLHSDVLHQLTSKLTLTAASVQACPAYTFFCLNAVTLDAHLLLLLRSCWDDLVGLIAFLLC